MPPPKEAQLSQIVLAAAHVTSWERTPSLEALASRTVRVLVFSERVVERLGIRAVRRLELESAGWMIRDSVLLYMPPPCPPSYVLLPTMAPPVIVTLPLPQ